MREINAHVRKIKASLFKLREQKKGRGISKITFIEVVKNDM